MAIPDEDHYWLVATRVLEGKVIPFLGAGAGLVDRPEGCAWKVGRYLPSGAELAEFLAKRSRYPYPHDGDLLRVSQYVDAVLGERALYEFLRSLFDADYPPNALQRFLARLAQQLYGRTPAPLLILTTNYDDALERAFDQVEVPYELLWYEAKHSRWCGRFLHQQNGTSVVIERPNEYTALAASGNPVILKLHGAVNRRDAHDDSYVITEDNYIDYLSKGDIAAQIPMTLRAQMAESHFLFLGYSLRDWNLRVILNRLWGEQALHDKSWAVQREPEDARLRKVEEKLWTDRGDVEVLYILLAEYVSKLEEQIRAESGAEHGR
jgi:SIR2-like domain